ncbi:MAG: response regulator, partial [Planctomycetaceae bacterium]
MQRVLIIEDDAKLSGSLRRGLAQEGFEPAAAQTGEEGYYLVTTESFDAVVLDWMLPKRDGMRVLHDLRAHGVATPVLILTARDAVEDRVAGLDAGADDYLVKPFAFAELVARLRALLVDNGSKRKRSGSVAAVEIGSAQQCGPVKRRAWGVSPKLDPCQ